MTEETNKKRILPLPELIDGTEWEVRESDKPNMGYVDLENKQMVVPTQSDPIGEFVRAHEAMHIAITPRKDISVASNVDVTAIQAMEDYRVNGALNLTGINTNVQTLKDSDYVNFLKADKRMAGYSLFASHHLGDGEQIREIMTALHPDVVDIVDQIRERYFSDLDKGKVPSFEHTIQAATEFTNLVEKAEQEEQEENQQGQGDGFGGGDSGRPKGDSQGNQPKGSGKSSQGEGNNSQGEEEEEGQSPNDGDSKEENEESQEEKNDKDSGSSESSNDGDGDGDGEGEGEGDKEGDKTQQETPKKPQKSVKADEFHKPFSPPNEKGGRVDSDKLPSITKREEEQINEAGIKTRWPRDGSCKPGILKEEFPALTVPYRPKKGLVKVADELGVVPVRLNRYATDMRIFQQRIRKVSSVAMLIDCSQSMYLEEDDISWVLEECPSAVIALYAGDERRTGKLRIIASQKMRMAGNPLEGLGRNNIVDIPALRWLANRKEKKKIWVSDGCITGSTTGGYSFEGELDPKYLREAARIITSSRIIRVNHFEDLKRSDLLRYESDGMYLAGEHITCDGYDLNGWGCGICDEPNCSWWANYKRAYMRQMKKNGGKKPTKGQMPNVY